MAFLATCGDVVNIYEVPGYTLRQTYSPFKGDEKIKTIALSSEGQFLASVPQKGPVEIAVINKSDIRKYQNVRNFEFPSAVAFQRNTKRMLAVGSARGEVAIYDIKTMTCRKRLEPLRGSVTHLEFNMRDSQLAAGCSNGQVSLYNVVTNIKSKPIKINRLASLSALKFHTMHKSTLGAGDDDGSIAVWDINMKSPKLFIKDAHVAPCTDIAFSPVNTTLVTSVGYDSTFNCYDMGSKTKVVAKLMPGPLCSLDIDQSGNIVSIASRNGDVFVMDLRNCNKILKTIKAHSGEISNVIYRNPDSISTSSIEISSGSCLSVETPEATRVKDDSFLEMLALPRATQSTSNLVSDEEIENESEPKHQSVSSTDSFLEAMGIAEPIYEKEPPTGTVDSTYSEQAPVDVSQTQSSNIFSSCRQVGNELHISAASSIAASNEPISETVPPSNQMVAIDSSEILTAIDVLNQSLGLRLDEVMENVRNVSLNTDEILEKQQTQFFQLRLGVVKQFIVQELKLDKMHQELLKEVSQLRLENEKLRAELRKVTNII